MKYAIIGAGPIGAGLAGLLAKAGEEVWLIDHNQDHVDAINKNGLELTFRNNADPVRTEKIKLHAAMSAEGIGPADIVILSVKGTATRSAVSTIKEVTDRSSIIISNQNGLGNADILKEYFPEDQIAYTVVQYGGSKTGLGAVEITAVKGADHISVTSENPGLKEKLLYMGKVLKSQDFNLVYYPERELKPILWRKLTLNCSLNAPCTLLHAAVDEFLSCNEGSILAQEIIKECCAVAAAEGIEITDEEIARMQDNMLPKSKESVKHYPSMVTDFERGRKTEIQSMNGIIVKLGTKNGVPTPYNDAIVKLMAVAERNFR